MHVVIYLLSYLYTYVYLRTYVYVNQVTNQMYFKEEHGVLYGEKEARITPKKLSEATYVDTEEGTKRRFQPSLHQYINLDQ